MLLHVGQYHDAPCTSLVISLFPMITLMCPPWLSNKPPQAGQMWVVGLPASDCACFCCSAAGFVRQTKYVYQVYQAAVYRVVYRFVQLIDYHYRLITRLIALFPCHSSTLPSHCRDDVTHNSAPLSTRSNSYTHTHGLLSHPYPLLVLRASQVLLNSLTLQVGHDVRGPHSVLNPSDSASFSAISCTLSTRTSFTRRNSRAASRGMWRGGCQPVLL